MEGRAERSESVGHGPPRPLRTSLTWLRLTAALNTGAGPLADERLMAREPLRCQ